MAEIRIGRGWSDAELERRLERARQLPLNFSTPQHEMTLENGWNHYYSESVIATEPPGPPEADGAFQRARAAVEGYRYSDPGIVTGHFDPATPLLGRRMLLECKIWGLRFLVGVVVGATRAEAEQDSTTAGFRYDTLAGHFEVGSEWFVVTKDHASGAITFRIDGNWRPGEFPNWWSRLGFALLGARYQERWHRRAHDRLALLARYGSLHPPRPVAGKLVHTGPEVDFQMRRGERPSVFEQAEQPYR